MRRALVSFLAILVLCFGIALASASGDSSRPRQAAQRLPTAATVDHGAQLLQAQAVVEYGQALERQQVGSYLHARAQAELVAYLASIPPPAPSVAVEPDLPPAPAVEVQQSWPTSLYPCGGDLPPCYVKARESGGDYNAQNPTSSASGAWQFLDSTWAGYGGYSRAVDAPPAVQDARARELWAGGAGCGHWSAC